MIPAIFQFDAQSSGHERRCNRLVEEQSSQHVISRDVTPSLQHDCRVTEYGYTPVTGSDAGYYEVGKPRSVTEFIQGQPVSKVMYAYPQWGFAYTQTSTNYNAAWDDANNEKTDSIVDDQYRLIQADNTDHTTTFVQYIDTQSPPGRLTKTFSGVSGYSVGPYSFTAGTRVEEQVDTLGRMISRKIYDLASGSTLVGQEIY